MRALVARSQVFSAAKTWLAGSSPTLTISTHEKTF